MKWNAIKITTSILLLFIISVNGYSQIDYENPSWETGCDTIGEDTQLEMNICSLEKFEIADSILNIYYTQILNTIGEEYKNEWIRYFNIMETTKIEYLKILKQQKKNLVDSRQQFMAYRESMVKAIRADYAGGSIRPLIENSYASEITVNQIRILEKMKDDFTKG